MPEDKSDPKSLRSNSVAIGIKNKPVPHATSNTLESFFVSLLSVSQRGGNISLPLSSSYFDEIDTK
jgi:hypothetical protein